MFIKLIFLIKKNPLRILMALRTVKGINLESLVKEEDKA